MMRMMKRTICRLYKSQESTAQVKCTHTVQNMSFTYRTRHCSVSLPPTTSGGTRRISKAMTRRSFTISFVGLIPIFFTLPATVDAPASHCTSQQWNDLMVGSSSSRVESRRFLPESICLMESIFCCLSDAWVLRFGLAQQLAWYLGSWQKRQHKYVARFTNLPWNLDLST